MLIQAHKMKVLVTSGYQIKADAIVDRFILLANFRGNADWKLRVVQLHFHVLDKRKRNDETARFSAGQIRKTKLTMSTLLPSRKSMYSLTFFFPSKKIDAKIQRIGLGS